MAKDTLIQKLCTIPLEYEKQTSVEVTIHTVWNWTGKNKDVLCQYKTKNESGLSTYCSLTESVCGYDC